MTSRRTTMRRTRGLVWLFALFATAQLSAAPLPDLRWRLLGPLRSGWSTCATGACAFIPCRARRGAAPSASRYRMASRTGTFGGPRHGGSTSSSSPSWVSTAGA